MNQPHIEEDIGFAPDIHSSTDSYAMRFSGVAGNWLLKIQQKVTHDYLSSLNPEQVLDIGGGHGQNIPVIEALHIPLTITGSDLSCQKRVNDLSRAENTRFVIGDLNNLPFPDQHYPVVISYRIISHMQNWEDFIDELTRVSDDRVIVDFASKRSVNWFSELAYTLKQGKENDTRRYNVLAEASVDAAFAKNNFTRSRRTPQFFFPMAIHRALKSPGLSNTLENLSRWLGLTYLFGSPIISEYRREK